MSASPGNETQGYVVFDRATGRIVATHTVVDGETGQPVPVPTEAVFAAMFPASGAKERAALDVMAVKDPAAAIRSRARVLTGRRELAPAPRVVVRPDRKAIKGDGKDAAELAIEIVDESGKADSTYSGKLKVVTQRGRLSAEGGVVDARGGKAKITLTSVPETLHRVRVRVADVAGDLVPGSTEIEFL